MLGNPPWGRPPTAQPVVVPYQQAVAPLSRRGIRRTSGGNGLADRQRSAQLGGGKGMAALPIPPVSGTVGLTGVKQGVVYQPGSADVIGSNLAVIQPGCQGFRGFLCKRCAPASHCKFECPKRYAEILLPVEPCPGFDDQGVRVPGAWYGSSPNRHGTRGRTTSAGITSWLQGKPAVGLRVQPSDSCVRRSRVAGGGRSLNPRR